MGQASASAPNAAPPRLSCLRHCCPGDMGVGWEREPVPGLFVTFPGGSCSFHAARPAHRCQGLVWLPAWGGVCRKQPPGPGPLPSCGTRGSLAQTQPFRTTKAWISVRGADRWRGPWPSPRGIGDTGGSRGPWGHPHFLTFGAYLVAVFHLGWPRLSGRLPSSHLGATGVKTLCGPSPISASLGPVAELLAPPLGLARLCRRGGRGAPPGAWSRTERGQGARALGTLLWAPGRRPWAGVLF